MNQILLTYNAKNSKKNYLKSILKYQFFFIFFIFLSTIILSFIFYNRYTIYKKNINSQNAYNAYKISTLYATKTHYNTLQLSNEISIVGLIEIPCIDTSYPILSKSNDELLKISPCRFSGPLPNRLGNLCIAGHNYKNHLMFSKLNDLNNNDSIFITDLNGNKLEYIVYDIYIINEDDLSCINQNYNIEITLITCNSTNNNKRIVVKAKMKES